MTEHDDDGFDAFVAWTREQVVQPMIESAFVCTLLPGDDIDVKIAVEIGAAILLDKPIVAIALPGRPVPAAMRRIATRIIEADLDTAEGRETIQLALDEVMADMEEP